MVDIPPLLSAESPGAGAVKFNIQKRPYALTDQNFPAGEQDPALAAATGTVASVTTAVTATAAGGVQKGWVCAEAVVRLGGVFWI